MPYPPSDNLVEFRRCDLATYDLPISRPITTSGFEHVFAAPRVAVNDGADLARSLSEEHESLAMSVVCVRSERG